MANYVPCSDAFKEAMHARRQCEDRLVSELERFRVPSGYRAVPRAVDGVVRAAEQTEEAA